MSQIFAKFLGCPLRPKKTFSFYLGLGLVLYSTRHKIGGIPQHSNKIPLMVNIKVLSIHHSVRCV